MPDESGTLVDAPGRAAPPPSPLKEHDLSGTTLGGYQLVRKVAEGGMGEVYEAIQIRLARRVALKILTERLASRPEFLQRFAREARAAAALNHPHVVQVYDFGEVEGRHYLVMEFVEGEDLADYVARNGRLTVAEGLAVIEQAVRALKAAHEKSIIHRDIKPANLMLTTAGVVKVSDLGLAKMLTEDTDVTATGVGIGSPHFLAPEQADDAKGVDHRADIYALGITLLYLLTGKKPYEGSSAFSVVLAHANKPLPSGLELGTELPEEIEAFIRTLSAKAPDDRYPDYDSLMADLERVKAGFAPAFAVGPALGPGPARRAGWAWVAGVGGLLTAGMLAVVLWPRGEAPSQPVTAKRAPQAPTLLPSQAAPPGPAQEARMAPGPRGNPGRPNLPGVQKLPLPVLPLPDRSPLKDGPLDKMLAEAEAYAKANPQQLVKIIDRYFQLSQKAAGTPRAAEIRQKLESWVLTHQLAAYEAIQEFKDTMLPLLQAHKPQEAYEVWLKFPAELRNLEVDQQIQQVLQEQFPPDFTPIQRAVSPARK